MALLGTISREISLIRNFNQLCMISACRNTVIRITGGVNMMQQLPKWWRLVCLAHMVIALIFGIIFIAIPEEGLKALGWTYFDPYISRMFAGALLAMAWAHLLSSKEKTIEKVLIPVQFYFIFDVCGTSLSLWAAVTYGLLSGWLLVVIFGFFMVAYAMVIFRK